MEKEKNRPQTPLETSQDEPDTGEGKQKASRSQFQTKENQSFEG